MHDSTHSFFTLSIIFSFLCSIWEAVLLSVNTSYIKRKVQEGHEAGPLLEGYKKDIDKPLSAILTLNTIAHTVGAIGVGAQAGKIFGDNNLSFGGLAVGYESIIAALMTLAILILSEIIPKTIGANKWKSLAPFTARSVKWLIRFLWPFVWLSQRITRGLKRDKDKSVLSRADITALTHVGEETGALHRKESSIIRNLLRLRELTVRDIMTPRTVILTVPESMTCGAFYLQLGATPHSRIPVFSDKEDNITGMVLKDTILAQVASDHHDALLSSIRIPINFLEDSLPLPEVMEKLSKQRAHLAMVVDTYGSIAGLVTMEDVMETLLGIEIMDESDTVADLQKLARAEWQKRAKALGIIE
ncbi:MAG: HlyC/CorC family transporter [Saprospiraceae bacterium]|nr:HlyC/CorC family transporter [Saprospiraceae bacterium]